MVCQLSNPEDYLWQGFMDNASMPYDEQMADELDFNLANAFPEPDSISDSEPEVINEDDEVRRLNPVKMETDDVKLEEPSTSASTSSTSLKGVSKIGDMTIINIDGLNQEQVWKVFEFIYNSVHYGVRYKELTQRKAVIMITAGFQGMLRYWWDDLNEASKSFILQGGIPKNFENVITLFFAAMVIQFLGSQQKIKDRYKEAFFRGKLCDLMKIKAYQQHMTHLMYQFPGGYFRAEYKQYYVNSFPSSFSNLVKERIKSAGLQIDDQITLAQINAFIDEVTDLECARLHMKKEFKQVKVFNSSFYNNETKSKDFGCAAAEKKCSCKVKNFKNKYGKKYKVARWTRKLSKEERKKVHCYICQKEGHIALECPKCKKHFGNTVLPKKYECEVVYCNRFEKHDIPISEYIQYESEEDETSDSTSFESPTKAVSTFSDDTSSVMFNMVRKPYAFPKKAKVRAESSSSSPSTTSRSEESELSWMKKRRPSTLNLSKKEQRDYRPLPLFSNMVEQAEEIAKTEEWRRMIHPDLRKNQGNLPSPVLQQNASTGFAIPKTTAKPSPSVVEKQLEKERQDRYCTEEHQLKAIQAMFSALEQVNNKIEQLHKLVLNTQSQSAAIEAKVDQCHGELQYLIDKAAMSEIAKEPVSEWKLQRPVNTCQVIPFNEKEHVSYFSEVWIKLPKIPSFCVDALWDTGAALSYLNQELVPPQLRQKLRHGIPISYATNSRGQINQTVQCQIALTNLKAQVTLYLHPHPNTDLTIGSDVISKLTPWAIQPTDILIAREDSLISGESKLPTSAAVACLPSVYNAGYLCNDQSQQKGLNIVMKVDPTSQGSLPNLVQWQEVEFPTEWKLDISKTLLNEAQQPMKMSIKILGLTDQYKLLEKSKSRKDLGLLMQRPQYREISESVSSNRPSSNRRHAKELTLCLHPETYKDTEGLYCCKLCNKLIAFDYLQNGVTVLTKEQVAEKELKYSEPYILPSANAKLQPMESASNWHTNILKEIAELQYSIISRIDAMVKAEQSATPSISAAPPPIASQQLVPLNYNTSASSSILPRMFLALQFSDILPDNFPQSESPFSAEDLADAFNPSFQWGNSAKNLGMKKRRQSTLNLSKKEQRDYRPLPLFSNMVEQAEEIAKTEEWRRMIHPGLRQNQGNLPSPVLQQTSFTDFAIPKTAAKPNLSIVEKQLEKERQDRYCAEEHQLKAIQEMFSTLEQVNNKIEQLHKLVLNTQSQSAAIEAKVDQCHGELQYLIDKAAMSKIAKEPVSEWKLQRPVNTCQVIPVNEKEHVSYFSEVWIKLPKIPSFCVDALWDTGAALSYLNQELVPPQLRQKLRHGIPVSYANNSRRQINQIVQCQIPLTNLKAQVALYLHPHPNTDLTIGSDVISKLTPWAIQPTGLITFSFNSLPYTITTKPRGSFLVEGVMPKLPNPTKELQYQQWFDQAKAKWSSELKICEDQLAKQTSDNPLAFWEREEYWISLPGNPKPKGLKATHPGMSIEDANLCKIKIEQMLKDGLICPSNNPYACQAFYVNNHSEQKHGKKRLVINYKPINDWLEHKRFPLPLKDDLLRRIKDCQVFSKFDLKSGFWQFKIQPEDRAKTSFVVPQGMFQWNVLPMGLKTAPSLCQERIERIFADYREYVLLYIDDILIYSKDVKSHVQHLQAFINKLQHTGLVLSLKKMEICRAKVSVLGIKNFAGNIQMQDHVLKKINQYPDQLSSKKEVQSFVGCLQWIAPQYLQLAKGLLIFKALDMCKSFFWHERLTQAVLQIKLAYSILPPL
ncbi:hypothetical protein L7F22_015990 [Adiantum nelumboides]|nr:hypothetical protein [Adiantum nelumboides]